MVDDGHVAAKKKLLASVRATAEGPRAHLSEEDIRVVSDRAYVHHWDFMFVDADAHDVSYFFDSDAGDPIHQLFPNPYLRVISLSGDDAAE